MNRKTKTNPDKTTDIPVKNDIRYLCYDPASEYWSGPTFSMEEALQLMTDEGYEMSELEIHEVSFGNMYRPQKKIIFIQN